MEAAIKEKDLKIPLYVMVYGTLSQWLRDGKYKPGEKLPGENVLAEQLQVSRGTIRQALLVLQEDGLIRNQQGKGNIVISNRDTSLIGLEKMSNAILDYSLEGIDRVETTIGFQSATQKYQDVLKLKPSSVIAVIDITYYKADTPVAFAMVYMPQGIIDQSDVNLEDTNTVYKLYSELLEASGMYSDTRIRMGVARERLANVLQIEEGTPLLIMEEELYTEYDLPVLSHKLFFLSEQCELRMRRKNDRLP
jgi:GntR family transcriptional regulator